MELFTLIISAAVLVETTALLNGTRIRTSGSARGSRKVFVDTSVLIDGRILPVAQTGFISDELIVPRSVLAELQLLADGSDSDKRSRARFGLDVLADLQKIDSLSVTILRDDTASDGVDNHLLELARKHDGLIMTNDFNLNKVAVVEGITVLNINDLAQSLRSEFLPGDKLNLELVQKGSEHGQAVGYLADGTMVVVEDSASFVGKTVEVDFVRYLQTSAGKMMFAKRHGKTAQPVQSPQNGQSGGQSQKPRGRRGGRNKSSDGGNAQPVLAPEAKPVDSKPANSNRPSNRPVRAKQSQQPPQTPANGQSGPSASAAKPEGSRRPRQQRQSSQPKPTDNNLTLRRRSRGRETNEERLVRIANK